VSFLTAIVVSYNSSRWLPLCLEALQRSIQPIDIVVVDNASEDGSAEVVAGGFADVRLIQAPANLGYSGGANVGLEAARTDLAVVMNADVVVEPKTLSALAAAFESDPQIAIAGAKLLYPDKVTVQHAGAVLSRPSFLPSHRGYGQNDDGRWDLPSDVDFVTGALIGVRRSAFAAGRWFDEGFYPAYFEEPDLCQRARAAGNRVVYWPMARAIHHESVTVELNSEPYYRMFHRGRIRYALKHSSPESLWHEFVPSELALFESIATATEIAAMRSAYDASDAVMLGRFDGLVARPDHVEPLERTRIRRQVVRLLSLAATDRLVVPQLPSPAVEPGLVALLESLAAASSRTAREDSRGSGSSPLRLADSLKGAVAEWSAPRIARNQAAMAQAIVDALASIESRLADIEARLSALAATDRRIEWEATEDAAVLGDMLRERDAHNGAGTTADQSQPDASG
jgi:O-antigen biosynthesis protein